MRGTIRLPFEQFFCLCTERASWGWGREAMQYVEAARTRLYFEECGYGYPVMFIHEFALQRRAVSPPLRLGLFTWRQKANLVGKELAARDRGA